MNGSLKTLVFSDLQAGQIAREAAAAYPNECCGIIFGIEKGGERLVSRLEAVPNVFDPKERFHRFSISPKQLMDADRAAAERKELVLGFYHSHPDHPAQPSEYDREHAWPFYSYVIIAVSGGQPGEMKSWQLNEASEQFEWQGIAVYGRQ